MNDTPLNKVAVIGAGQMGQGIAHVCAMAGHCVWLVDADPERCADGLQAIQQRLQRLTDKGKLDAPARDRALSRLTQRTLAQAAPEADIIIEAVTEDLSAKLALFGRLDALAAAPCLLFSNTSSISLTRLAAATQRPGQVAGVHFMNPVPLMQLVEIVRALQTSPATLQAAVSFAEGLGKTTVVSADRPGFIVNRVLVPMLNEACFALQEGVASVEAIDQAITLGLNHPMGPLRLADLIGLDTVLAIAEVLHRDLGDDKYRPATVLRNLVSAGQYGYKTKLGFYDYCGAEPVVNSSLR